MPTTPPASLLSFLAAVPDPRSAHGRRHDLAAMLAAVCCAILCGARGFKPIAQWLHDQDIALAHALGFRRKPPKWGAFRKLLIALDPVAFEGAVARWAEATSEGLPPGRAATAGWIRPPWTARRCGAPSAAMRGSSISSR
jgi:hypothetical protein